MVIWSHLREGQHIPTTLIVDVAVFSPILLRATHEYSPLSDARVSVINSEPFGEIAILSLSVRGCASLSQVILGSGAPEAAHWMVMVVFVTV